MNKISIVVPCYNEEASIPIFYKVIEETLKSMKIDYELIFIDDGSKDKTLEILKNIKDKHVKYISFSRNFGKEAAIYAGLNECSGDFVATMDVDLQDPPSLIPIMYETLKKEDFDCIGTRRVTRKGEPKIRSFFARMFYKIINKISNVEMVDGARDFRLMTRQMVDSILSLKEYNRYSKGIFSFVGFKTKWLEYENIERVAGETKWSFFKLFIYAIEGIVAFSNFPLIISIIFSTLSFVSSIILLIIMIINGFKELLVILSILLFIFSLLFLILGIIGVYVGKIILEVRKRPIYVVRESNLR
ncbi:MAG: glycosyltransferase family 2 protein [Firmicutes bacterium]|nr:glycosyltransferase family 2 protein [Bacillota bacterium]